MASVTTVTPIDLFVVENSEGNDLDAIGCNHMSHEKNPTLLSIESWLVNRDPYFMVYYNPHITG